jgi:hypothetical protein
MTRRRWMVLSVPVLAVIALMCLPPTAHAVLRLGASVDGGATIFAIDNDATSTCPSPVVGGCQLPDVDPTVGNLTLLTVIGAFGDLNIGISTQMSDIASGPGFLNRLDTTGTQVTNNGAIAHSLSMAISSTDFAGPNNTASVSGAGQWSTLSQAGAFGGSRIAMQWFNDPNNGQGALNSSMVQPGNLVASFSDVAGPTNPDSFSTNQGPFTVNDPGLYSMTLQFDATIGPGVRLTGRELTEVKSHSVSEPGTLALLGIVLAGLGFVRRRKLH